jgi:hypothetical protein
LFSQQKMGKTEGVHFLACSSFWRSFIFPYEWLLPVFKSSSNAALWPCFCHHISLLTLFLCSPLHF